MVERLKDVLCGWSRREWHGKRGGGDHVSGVATKAKSHCPSDSYQGPKQAHSFIISCPIPMCLIRTYFLFPIPQNRHFYSQPWLIFQTHPPSYVNPLVPTCFWVLVFLFTCQDNSVLPHDLFFNTISKTISSCLSFLALSPHRGLAPLLGPVEVPGRSQG